MPPYFDVVVVGSGLAGLAAAGHAARAGLSTASIEPELFGGMVSGINHLDGLPEGDRPSGVSLAGGMMAENTGLGVEQISSAVTGLSREGRTIVVVTDGESISAGAVVLASGATKKRLNVPGEAELRYRGVSECADCDGPLYSGRTVVAVGGGDSALQEAAALADYCERVLLVHRGSQFQARPDLVRGMHEKRNIEVRLNSVVDAILGSDGVSAVRIRNLTMGDSGNVPCAGVFSYIGLEPSSGYVPADIDRDANGAIRTDASMLTSMPGVFAIGAVRAGYGGRIVDAWSEATTAIAAARGVLKGRIA